MRELFGKTEELKIRRWFSTPDSEELAVRAAWNLAVKFPLKEKSNESFGTW